MLQRVTAGVSVRMVTQFPLHQSAGGDLHVEVRSRPTILALSMCTVGVNVMDSGMDNMHDMLTTMSNYCGPVATAFWLYNFFLLTKDVTKV